MLRTKFLGGVVSLMSSRRAYLALLVDGLFSVSSLLLAVAVARSSGIEEFGAFGLATVLYLFSMGLIRAAVTDTTLSLSASKENLHSGFQRATLMSLFIGGILVAGGLVAGSHYLVIVGVSTPGLAALDYIRVTNSAMYRPLAALLLGASWTTCVFAISIAALVVPVAPLVVFAVWSGSGSIIGLVAWVSGRFPWRPQWRRNSRHTRAAAWFSVDYLAGSGGSLMSTSLLGGVLGTSVVAALRGAGTVLGPVNLLSTTARSLTLPYLTRARSNGGAHEIRSAALVTAVLMLAVSPLAIIILFIPYDIGVELLGESWVVVAPVLAPLAIESAAALAGSVASAGHRSKLAGGRALSLRLTVGIVRPVAVVAAGTALGAVGAAWTMAAISILNVILWWASYWQLTRSDVQANARVS
jgi:O-antigen/teichoic acid export membrane protein